VAGGAQNVAGYQAVDVAFGITRRLFLDARQR